MTTSIVLIRHGETAWNAERRLQGHIDIALNEEGLRPGARPGSGTLRRHHLERPAARPPDRSRAGPAARPAGADRSRLARALLRRLRGLAVCRHCPAFPRRVRRLA